MVNCRHKRADACVLGVYDDPSPMVCAKLCDRREPIDVGLPALTSPVPQPAAWPELHRRPLDHGTTGFAEWFAGFRGRIACGTCREHFDAYLAANPPDTTDADALFAWTVAAHNAVNERLGKPIVSVGEARQLWSR